MIEMKCLHITGRCSGGAFLAAQRLAVISDSISGVESKCLSIESIEKKYLASSYFRKLRKFIQSFFSKLMFLSEYLPYSAFVLNSPFVIRGLKNEIGLYSPDVVVLHWLGDEISSNKVIKIISSSECNRVFFHLSDFQYLTGGCHFLNGCDGYKMSCTHCKMSKNKLAKYLVSVNKKNNNDYLRLSNSLCVAFNKLMIDSCDDIGARCIYYTPPISQVVFSPVFDRVNQNGGCKVLVAAYDKEDTRKGLNNTVDFVLENKKTLINNNVQLIVFEPVFDTLRDIYPNVVSEQIRKSDEELAGIYQYADVMITTPYEDAGPMMVYEALLCGVFIVSTRVGAADELELQENGIGLYLDNPNYQKILAEQLSRSIDKMFISKKTVEILNQRTSAKEMLIG